MNFLLLLTLINAANASSNKPVAIEPGRIISCRQKGLTDTLDFKIPAGDAKPEIEFPYDIQATRFSVRTKNLLLIAQDKQDPTRVRVVISAQLDSKSGVYRGQAVQDMGGNEVQLDSGPVVCSVLKK